MTTTSTTTDVVRVEPLLTGAERVALAGFLAGHSNLTRDAYALDLRRYTSWCQRNGLRLFAARRPDIECFGLEIESCGRARATIARRVCTVSGFYRYAVEEELLKHPPAVHVRRPRLDYESHAIGLDRNEVGSLLVAAGLGAANERALISLLGINGLRISEALGADIEKLGCTRAPHPHRPTQRRQGRRHPTRPTDSASPRPGHRGTTGRAARRAAHGPTLRLPDRAPRRREQPIRPHTLRHAFITAAPDASQPAMIGSVPRF